MSKEAIKLAMVDDEGENQAVRMFLAMYGGQYGITTKQMRSHLMMAGFDGAWPEWANSETHLTKAGAQLWIRHLFALAEQPAQQEPVAWRWSESNGQRWFDWTTDWSHHDKAKSMGVPIENAYTSPPARKPLTDKEIADIATSHPLTWVNLNTVEHRRYFARAIEAAHNIKEST